LKYILQHSSSAAAADGLGWCYVDAIMGGAAVAASMLCANIQGLPGMYHAAAGARLQETGCPAQQAVPGCSSSLMVGKELRGSVQHGCKCQTMTHMSWCLTTWQLLNASPAMLTTGL
jgi:hypothetical protein